MSHARTVPDPDAEPTITARRYAAVVGLSVRGVYAAIARGEIPSTRVGRRIVIPTRDALVPLGLLPDDRRDGGAAVPPAVPPEVLDRITRWRTAGLTSTAVARALTADEVPAPGGQPWSAALVEDALEAVSLARAV